MVQLLAAPQVKVHLSKMRSVCFMPASALMLIFLSIEFCCKPTWSCLEDRPTAGPVLGMGVHVHPPVSQPVGFFEEAGPHLEEALNWQSLS